MSQWGQYWTKDYFNGGADNLYRPLVSMSYAIQAKLHGTGENRAWAFHLVNWLLHAMVSAAVAELARRLFGSSAIGLVAGLLFAVHPIHVEAVANIVGRAELMCALATFTALVLFLRPLTIPRAVAIWGCFVLALLSKEQGMLLPALLLMLMVIPIKGASDGAPASSGGRKPAGSRPRLEAGAPSNAPVEVGATTTQAPGDTSVLSYASRGALAGRLDTPALTLLLLVLWTFSTYISFRERILKFWWDRTFLDPTINPMIQSTGIDRWLLPFSLLGRYLALLIAPIRLLPDYGGEVIGSHVRFNDPYFYLGVFAVIAWIVACLFAVRRRRLPILFCLLAIAVLYGMIANLLTLIGTNFAERLMYIPSAFVCILAAMVLSKVPRRSGVALAACVIVLFSVRTVTYAARWNQPIALFERGLADEPKSIRLYLLLCEEWERRGDLDRARRVMADAREQMPAYYRLWLVSARVEKNAGNFATARDFARRAQNLKPTQAGVQMLESIQDAESAAPAAAAPAPASTRPAREHE
jgi:hypothetical protein